MNVEQNLKQVQQKVEAACRKAGRNPADVTLIAVSKLQPTPLLREAYDAGQRDFGENYAQELRDKAVELAPHADLRWHAIGHLQRNKAKYVTKAAFAFHALDSLELAQELSARREGAPLQCFLEVNLGGEASKSGVAPEEITAFAEKVRALPNLSVVGLMALPPLAENPEQSRPYFRQLRELAQKVGLPQLSMGTTADYEVAIEEGATHVRVGTALFGARPAKQ